MLLMQAITLDSSLAFWFRHLHLDEIGVQLDHRLEDIFSDAFILAVDGA